MSRRGLAREGIRQPDPPRPPRLYTLSVREDESPPSVPGGDSPRSGEHLLDRCSIERAVQGSAVALGPRSAPWLALADRPPAGAATPSLPPLQESWQHIFEERSSAFWAPSPSAFAPMSPPRCPPSCPPLCRPSSPRRPRRRLGRSGWLELDVAGCALYGSLTPFLTQHSTLIHSFTASKPSLVFNPARPSHCSLSRPRGGSFSSFARPSV